MNSTLSQIINENNDKINYFKLLTKKNIINLSCDIVEDKIKPRFNKYISTYYFLNNIINIVLIKKLLKNFSNSVRIYKYNKLHNNFKNLIKYNRPLFEITILEELEEALNKTEMKISPGYENYYIITKFNNSYCYSLHYHLIYYMSPYAFEYKEYITAKKYKKWVLDKYKTYLQSRTDDELSDSFRDAMYHPYLYYRGGMTPLTINIEVRQMKEKKTEKLHNSKKLAELIK